MIRSPRMLPTTYRALEALAKADDMRLGAWLDQKVGPDFQQTDRHEIKAGLMKALLRRRLVNALWQTTVQARAIYDLVDEDPGLVKDDEVFKQLHVLALEWKPLRHHLCQAGLACLVG